MAERLTAINGSLVLDGADGAGARANITAIFRGEQVTLSGSRRRRRCCFLGKSVWRRSSSGWRLPPLSLEFNGSGSLGAGPVTRRATLQLASPSVRRALEWSGAEIKPGEALGALELTARLSAEPHKAKLDDLIILIDANRGIGVLDVELREDAPPLIAGTLAFNRLDIASFLQAFTPLPRAGEEIASTIDTRFLREIGLDLRLSAQSASFGPVALSNLAAAARVQQGRANFDVGDATVYGGNLIGRMALSEHGVDGGLSIQLSARETNFGAFFDAVDLDGPLPRGSGSLDIEVSSPYPTWATALTDLTGRISLSVDNGFVPGLDIAKFRELAATERFFDLEQLGANSRFPFVQGRFEAMIAAGEADLKTAELIGVEQTISLSGVIPYSRSSLAIAGVLDANPAADGATAAPDPAIAPVRFFVGGSWPQPVISPVKP
jgi:AsmA protein